MILGTNLWLVYSSGLRELQCTQKEAEGHLLNMAHAPFCIPGDPGFVLSSIMNPPATRAEAGALPFHPFPLSKVFS